MTLQRGDGEEFDSIVYAERQPRRWMAGSDFFNRTQDVNGPQETARPQALVHLAIVYGADRSITIYRNGEPYGAPYTPGTLPTYTAGDGHVLFGMRHGLVPTGNRMFAGEIDEATLYDRALTPVEVAGLVAARGLRFVVEPENQVGFAGETRAFTDLRAR